MTELLPCPFCGARLDWHDEDGGFAVHPLNGCRESGHQLEDAWEMDAWNKRAAPGAPSDAWCREIDDTARNGKEWLVWWPTVKLDDDGNLTDEVTGGTWLISMYQGAWVEPDCLNAIGEWFGDGHEYAAEPTHYRPLPPPLRPDGQTGGK
jgi:hypothetical protein